MFKTLYDAWIISRCKATFKKEYPLFYKSYRGRLRFTLKHRSLEREVNVATRLRFIRDYFVIQPLVYPLNAWSWGQYQNKTVVAFHVHLNKENTPMSVLPDYIMQHIKTPPAYILERMESSLHLFLDALKQSSEEGSEIRVNNRVASLNSSNFSSHPQVHRGYYESKRNGILYVRDCFTGESIRKDQSVLLSTGEFTLKDSQKVCHDVSVIDKTLMRSALAGSVKALESVKDKFYLLKDSFVYISFDPSMFKLSISPTYLCERLVNYYTSSVEAAGIPLTPESLEEHNSVEFFRQVLSAFGDENMAWSAAHYRLWDARNPSDVYNGYVMPDTSDFMAGWLIYDGDGFGHNMQGSCSGGIRPVITVNSHKQIKWNPSSGMGQAAILPNVSNSPFDFALICNQSTQVLVNRKSVNNEGRLLSYTTKVNDLKISFLMMPEEKAFFARCDKDFKARTKEWRDAKTQADRDCTLFSEKQPVKYPSEEPIYLGMEIEAVAKGSHRSDSGTRTIISEIANSSFGDHAIAKSDGSIGSYGLEIVTIPATLAYHRKMFEDHFFSAPNLLHKKIMATEQCGIHVHISKNSFSVLDLGKFMAFINDKKNSAFIDAMANRVQNMYCVRPATLGHNAKGVDVSAKAVKFACRNNSLKQGLLFRRLESFPRRSSVNLQNAHTVEVRIFKSSSDKNNTLRKLEFCESLVKFVRSHSMQQMTVYDYVNFLLSERALKLKDSEGGLAYPYLIRWLASKNYIDHERRMVKYVDQKDPDKKARNRLVHIYAKNKVKNPHPKKETK